MLAVSGQAWGKDLTQYLYVEDVIKDNFKQKYVSDEDLVSFFKDKGWTVYPPKKYNTFVAQSPGYVDYDEWARINSFCGCGKWDINCHGKCISKWGKDNPNQKSFMWEVNAFNFKLVTRKLDGVYKGTNKYFRKDLVLKIDIGISAHLMNIKDAGMMYLKCEYDENIVVFDCINCGYEVFAIKAKIIDYNNLEILKIMVNDEIVQFKSGELILKRLDF